MNRENDASAKLQRDDRCQRCRFFVRFLLNRLDFFKGRYSGNGCGRRVRLCAEFVFPFTESRLGNITLFAEGFDRQI